MKTKLTPTYSINKLADILKVDRRTLTKALSEAGAEPAGQGPNGPLWTKMAGVNAMLIHRRGGKEQTFEEFTERMAFFAVSQFEELMASESDLDQAFQVLNRYDLARFRGVNPWDKGAIEESTT